MTLLFVLLAFTWSGLAAWTYLDHRSCSRCDGALPHASHDDDAN